MFKYFLYLKEYMSSTSKSGSRRKPSVKAPSSKQKKEVKAKARKPKAAVKSLKKEATGPTLQDIVGKTLASLERLGGQTFALSPFSQYHDDWLLNLRQVVSIFETSPNVKVYKSFTKECEKTFSDIQIALTEHRKQEDTLAEAEKALQNVKQTIGKVDADYAEKNHKLTSKHDADNQQLTTQIKTLEEDIANQKKIKISFFQFSAKKASAKKLEQTQQALIATKNQLDETSHNFLIEQDKLQAKHKDEKQALSTKFNALRKEIERLEVDTSLEARQKTCARLCKAVTNLSDRLSAKANK